MHGCKWPINSPRTRMVEAGQDTEDIALMNGVAVALHITEVAQLLASLPDHHCDALQASQPPGVSTSDDGSFTAVRAHIGIRITLVVMHGGVSNHG